MKRELSDGAFKLLKSLCTSSTDVFKDYFNAREIYTRRKAGFKDSVELNPVLKELEEEGVLVKAKQEFRSPKYKINPIKAEKVLEKWNEEKTIYTQEYRDALEDEIKKYKKFVITTAVMGKGVNLKFVKSLRNYAKRNKALLLVLPCEDVASRGKKAKSIELSPELSDFRVVFKDTYLNSNLCLCAIKVSAKQINPLTGLDRMAVMRDASLIVASPKVFLKYVPNMHYEVPPAIMTTGAVTENNYDTDKYMSKRTSMLAENDHAYGAVIVEIENDRIFHFRHVRASHYGSVTDLGIDYLPDGDIKKMEDSFMVIGDSHTGYHDVDLYNSEMQLAKDVGVTNVALHDVFNAASISHHDIGKGITKAIKAREQRLSLEEECKLVKDYIKSMEDLGLNVVIVDSNHDKHLLKYLENGRYIDDPVNYEFSLKLALAAVEGNDPLKYAIEKLLKYKSERVYWLPVDASCKAYGVEIGIHGHRGANGSKGSLSIFEKGIGNCVTAHTHTAAILREACSVGTSSLMDMKYNQGLSNWTRTCCLIYSNGTKQLVNFISVAPDKFSCRA